MPEDERGHRSCGVRLGHATCFYGWRGRARSVVEGMRRQWPLVIRAGTANEGRDDAALWPRLPLRLLTAGRLLPHPAMLVLTVAAMTARHGVGFGTNVAADVAQRSDFHAYTANHERCHDADLLVDVENLLQLFPWSVVLKTPRWAFWESSRMV